MKKLLIILASAAVLLSGCDSGMNGNEEEIVVNGEISLSLEEILFLEDGTLASSSNTVTIKSNEKWVLSGKTTSWCTPSVKDGGNGTAVTFTAEANTEDVDRELVYNFICGNKAAKLTVKQLRKNSTEIGKSEYSFDRLGGNISVFVKSTAEPELSFSAGDDQWIEYKGRNSETTPQDYSWWFFEVKENEDYLGRDGYIYFNEGTDSEQKVKVSQGPVFTIIPITDKTQPIETDITEGFISVDVKSNIEGYTVRVNNNVNWLKLVGEEELAGHDLPAKRFTFSVGEALGTRTGGFSVFANSPVVITHNFTVKQVNYNPVLIDFSVPIVRALTMYGSDYAIQRGDKYELTDAGARVSFINLNGQGLESITDAVKDIEDHLHYVNRLMIQSNRLSEVDVSGLTSLEYLMCGGNGISVLKLGDNRITDVNFGDSHYHYAQFGAPQTMTVSGKYLQSLNINHMGTDMLEELDLSECPSIRNVSCYRMNPKIHTIWLKTGQQIPTIQTNCNYTIKYR